MDDRDLVSQVLKTVTGELRRRVNVVIPADTYYHTISKKVKKEAVRLDKKGTFKPGTSGATKLDSYKQLNWKSVLKDIRQACPILMRLLQSSLPYGRLQTHLQHIRMINVISVLMFLRNPSQNKVLQELTGMILWFAGCRRETFQRLNRLGVSANIKTTTRCIDMIRDFFDEDLKKQKETIERVCGHAKRPPNRRLFEEPSASSEEWVDVDLDADEVEEGLSQADCSTPINTEKADISPKPVGFTLVFDNVNQHTRTRCSSTDHSNRQLNLVQCYAAVDRVPCFHLSDAHPSVEEIEAISGDVFLPTMKDIELLRMEYLVTIKRILSTHIPVFKDMEVTEHIPHPHSSETKKKSKIVPLGVLQKDETKVSDMIDVLDHLTQYVPKDSSSQPIISLLYGDQLSCERHRDAQNARVNEESQWDRLLGLHPAIQEWHKRLLTLQDDFALLYNAKSMRSCGTLSFIKSRFSHTNVTERISHCFNYATGLLRFTTEGYVLAAALHHMGITTVNEEPEDGIPADVDAYFDQICNGVLDLAFHPLHQKPLLSEEDIPYCLCRSFKQEDMIGCDNPSCNRGAWFHYSCVSLTQNKVPEGDWFCSECCKKQASGKKAKKPDLKKSHKFEYTKAVLFHGLGEMVRHDAIREGDGDRILAHWRFDMLRFYLNRHWKYLIEGHHLLMDVSGALSPRLAYQLTWNRTVNIHGGTGNNIAMDLEMEFLNKNYKESSKSAAGNLSEQVIQRYSQASGLKGCLTRLFDQKITGKKEFCKKLTKSSRLKDTIKLAEMLLRDRCLEVEPGRCHAGFEHFEFQQEFKQGKKFREKMAELSKKRIKRERLTQYCRLPLNEMRRT
ncbi:uncharacterized protein [Diadema antillarum]|uniref:uncharacterized protein n=1 Tax=Diadema antillarum TaxID=105358 RepID=UPI003A8B552A